MIKRTKQYINSSIFTISSSVINYYRLKKIKYEEKTKIRWIIEKKIKNKYNINLTKSYIHEKGKYILIPNENFLWA